MKQRFNFFNVNILKSGKILCQKQSMPGQYLIFIKNKKGISIGLCCYIFFFCLASFWRRILNLSPFLALMETNIFTKKGGKNFIYLQAVRNSVERAKLREGYPNNIHIEEPNKIRQLLREHYKGVLCASRPNVIDITNTITEALYVHASVNKGITITGFFIKRSQWHRVHKSIKKRSLLTSTCAFRTLQTALIVLSGIGEGVAFEKIVSVNYIYDSLKKLKKKSRFER